MRKLYPAFVTLLLLVGGCATAPRPGDALFDVLRPYCGQAFEGKLVEGTEPSDAAIGNERLVMHVRDCSADEIRIPFHVGGNRSRTWVLTRIPEGIRLKHIHRHEDGHEDRVTRYGGDAHAPAGTSVDFPADDDTKELLPAAATNIWTVAVDGERKTFTYALRREAMGRRFRVEFDLGRAVEVPAAAW